MRELLARTDHIAIDRSRVVLAAEISNAYGIEHAPAAVVLR
jgi:hypothetical protein